MGLEGWGKLQPCKHGELGGALARIELLGSSPCLVTIGKEAVACGTLP